MKRTKCLKRSSLVCIIKSNTSTPMCISRKFLLDHDLYYVGSVRLIDVASVRKAHFLIENMLMTFFYNI